MISEPCVKINLGLRVLRRRPDGYHDLETVFVPYQGIRDRLEITPADELSVDIAPCSWDPMEDLTVKAWRLLKADFPQIPPVHIRLRKFAPVGAGLGGGSSDAAFALRMIDGLFGLNLTDADLAAYAAGLGSDCAFFVYNRPMLGTGRGEVLVPVDPDLSAYDIRVEVPAGESVSTREAYGGIVPYEGGVPLMDVLSLPVERWRDLLVNDFEATVLPLHPGIAALKEDMYSRGAVYAAMSGSGSAVFGLFKR